MNSQALPQFWKLYDWLPKNVRRRASKAYRIWQQNPETPGLHFKRVGNTRSVYSVRIGDDFVRWDCYTAIPSPGFGLANMTNTSGC